MLCAFVHYQSWAELCLFNWTSNMAAGGLCYISWLFCICSMCFCLYLRCRWRCPVHSSYCVYYKGPHCKHKVHIPPALSYGTHTHTYSTCSIHRLTLGKWHTRETVCVCVKQPSKVTLCLHSDIKKCQTGFSVLYFETLMKAQICVCTDHKLQHRGYNTGTNMSKNTQRGT